MNRIVSNCILMLTLLMLAACGFQLRGQTTVSEELKTLYIQGVDTRQDVFGVELKRALTRNGIEVVDDYREGAALFTVLENNFNRHILSVGSDAKVREYELEAQVVFQITDDNGELIGSKQRVEARRDYQFDRTQILAMDEQERVLRQDLNQQMVQSILRRLSVMK
jgi:LPS-assembly lipoprotein